MKTKREPIRVLIADDQLLFADSLARVLAHDAEDMDVVGVARDGAEAIAMALGQAPDVILMDVRMPGVDGVEATKQILHDLPSVRVIMLTTFEDDAYVNEALSIGAAGYLLKDTPLDDLIAYVRLARRGTVLVSDAVVSKMIEVEKEPREGEAPLPAWVLDLTKREIQILSLLVEGLENGQIAHIVNLGEQTVKNYVSTIYSKIGVHDRVSAVRKVLDDGVILPSVE